LPVPAASLAQPGPAVIAGRVLSALDETPLEFVSVIVEDATSGRQVSGMLTGPDGRFVLRGLGQGSYRVRLSFPGFHPAEADVLVSALNQSYDIGVVRLPRLEGVQETVAVTADAPLAVGVDTQVFRLDSGPSQSTGTLLDALKNLPGVTVDQEGKVSLRGSDRVAILIDGRQSSLTGFGSQRGLDGVAAANVEAIEIINNPSARFDAAGMAGVINIIYKQERQLGLSGDVGLGMGLGQFSKRRADLPTDLGSFDYNGKAVPSLNLNYRTSRLRTFVQGEVLFQDDLPNNEFTTRTYDDGRVIQSQVPENREQYHYTLRTGADWYASAATTLSVSGVYDFERHVDVAQVPFILQSTGQRERFWFWREQEDTGYTNATLNARHRFATPGHELAFNLQYTRGKEDEAYYLNEDSRVRVGTDYTHLVAVENTLPLSIDYTRPLRTGRIEIGAKLQQRWIPVTYTVERGLRSVIYDGLGDYSDWDERILAAYVNVVRVTPRYTLEGGVRVEDTRVSYRIPTDNIYYPGDDAYEYFEVFPNAKLTYSMSSKTKFITAYNRRVDRPGEPELRIFPKYDDPEVLKVGNPFLRPQFTHAAEVGLARSWTGGSATAAVFHRNIDDAFLRVFAIDDSNPSYDIVNRIYENAGNSRQTGIQAFVAQEIGASWRLSGNATWYRNAIDALETTLLFPARRSFAVPRSSDGTWDIKINNQIRLPRAAELQVNASYYAKRNVP
jgi:Outer membrane protein beta-barrel family/Carboxypeptidase regulatory-like domain/TonB-dependent Receptor Plug Domain